MRRRKDFLEIYALGSRWHSRHFLLFSHTRPGCPQRLGIAVSRKVGNAVARSRIKRLLREYFRLLNFSLPGAQLAVVAKSGASVLRLADVMAELNPIMGRLGRIGRNV